MMRPTHLLRLALVLAALVACTPKVQVQAPEKLVIDMNVKIDHEVRVKVERELEKSMETNEEIF